jgi:hypothetical protein
MINLKKTFKYSVSFLILLSIILPIVPTEAVIFVVDKINNRNVVDNTWLAQNAKKFVSILDVNYAEAATNPIVGLFSPSATWTYAGNANLNLRQPDPRAGDLMIATIAIRPAANTVNTPTGWTLLDSRTGTDGGAEGADTGSVGYYVFYKVANGSEGTANQTFTENGTTSVWGGSITQVRSSTGTYNLSASGYSINGDATNWNGTLDSDIGLTAGDLVIIGAATNGNLSAHSAQNITATGITAKGTVREHGEYGATTGNDIEQTLSTAHIWTGTNSATPTITYTQSAASSGVVEAIRIRQGAGTRRTDTYVRSAGAQVGGSTSVALPYPEHDVGDRLILFVANRYDTATPTTPANWTLISNSFTGGLGTNAADAGTARISAYYRDVTTQLTGTQSVTVTSGNTSIGQIIAIHKDDVESWSMDFDGGADTVGNASWSTTGTDIDLSASDGGDIVLVGSSINTDARLYSAHALSASGITFGDVTETSEFRSATGNDMSFNLTTSRVSSGSANGVALTHTKTANGSTVSAPTGPDLYIAIKGSAPVPVEVPTVTTQSASSVTDTGATLNGNITSTGGEDATVRGFAWGTSATMVGDTATTTENGTFSTGSFTDSSLTLTCNTTYYSRAYATNSAGTGYGAISSSFTTGACSTTLGSGTDPSTDTVGPGSGVENAGSFTLKTNSGSDSVTAVTVILSGAGTPYDGLSQVSITSNDGSTTYFSAISDPSSNTLNFSGGTPIPVTSSQTQFRIRITPKTHANMTSVPGAEYDISPYVSTFTSTNGQAGSDSNTNTLTIDNLSPGNVTGATTTGGDEEVSLAWTNPADADFDEIIVLRHTSLVSDVPVEGTNYNVGNTIGSATVACVTYSTSCTDT